MRNKHRKQERNARKAMFVRSGIRVRHHRGIIYITGVMPRAQLEAFREQWLKLISGVEGWHKPVITNAPLPKKPRRLSRRR